MLTIVGGIFLPVHQGLGMEQRAIGTRSNLIDNTRFEINVEGTWDVLAAPCLREKGRKTIITCRR